jgi:DNA-binding SARP family transcriptional activator
LLGDAIDAAPVVLTGGTYRLNTEAGIGVDMACFDAYAQAGDRNVRAGDHAAAASLYLRAVRLYRGELCVGVDIQAVVQRERLRGRYLSLLAHLGDYAYEAGDYATCLDHAQRLLAHDPCREDAHRLAMRCHVRRGERAQAVQQYRLREQILRAELDAWPEHATLALFDQVRLSPDGV